ncbi:MAG: hypothetical protein D6702_10910 [Planctomycetota bacterium]|nr:MAG: hypothetical protein D6702_10910 [Planctomycetota bacterium]
MPRFLRPLFPALLFLLALAPAAGAQKARVGKEWFPDPQYGYRFKYPQDWMVAPVQPSERRLGLVAQFSGPDLSTKLPGNKVVPYATLLQVYAFGQKAAVTRDDDEGTGGLRGRLGSEDSGRQKIGDLLPHITIGDDWRVPPALEDEEEKKIRDLVAEHQVWKGDNGTVEIDFDCWTFHLDDHDIVLVFAIPDQHFKKWKKVFAGCAKTFQLIDREEAASFVDSSGSYEDLLAYHRDEVSRTPGWELLEVPSKRYLIKTSSKDKKFLQEVIDRLEKSRDLYERDFPPSEPIRNISVVRVCSTLEEFHKYGKTGGGVAGWFNPASEELVIVDFKNYDRKMTFGVISHEAFHQYCHFLFDQSEAHRWFDEGHGDYYGAFEFKGKKAIPHAKMAGGLDRLSVIREMVRKKNWVPIGEHIRYDHQTWQSKGIASYSESWAIIYFLRMGMLGEVPKKLWRPEYGQIIPNYVRTLNEGFRQAYAEIRQQMEQEAKAEGKEFDEAAFKEQRRWRVEQYKEKIWKDALDASWGQVDIEQFERDWAEYVDRYLKD